MIFRLTLLMLVLWLLLAAPAAAEEFPYTAFVDFENTPVRSGAGDQFHPTSLLRRGDAVEVWRHDAGGWRAIRPLTNSFSWVAARYVSRQPGSAIGQLNAGGVAAWIGSATGGTRSFHSQVKMKAGESVEILGERTAVSADGKTESVWLKIAPPAGEFRYINGIFLRRTPPKPISPPVANHTIEPVIQDAAVQSAALLVPVATPAPAASAANSTAATPPPAAAVASTPASAAGGQTPPAAAASVVNTPPPATVEGAFRELGRTLQPAPAAAQSTLSAPIAAPPAAVTSPAVTSPAATQSAAAPAVGAASKLLAPSLVQPAAQPLGAGATDVSQQSMAAGDTSPLAGSDITSLEVNLSLMAAKDQQHWQFAEMKKKTQAIIDHGSSALERGRARLLMARIEEFDALRRRALTPAPTAVVAAPVGPQLFSAAAVGVGVIPASAQLPMATGVAAASTLPSPAASTGVAAAGYTPRVNIAPGVDGAAPAKPPAFMGGVDPRFDGSGRLAAVATSQDHMPQFALTDSAGRVLQYVSPAPGFNLHRYVNQEIGVYGQRGYIPHLRAAHVTAQRVVILSRHR